MHGPERTFARSRQGKRDMKKGGRELIVGYYRCARSTSSYGRSLRLYRCGALEIVGIPTAQHRVSSSILR